MVLRVRLALTLALLGVGLLTLGLGGCDPEPIFGSCEFSASIVKTCEEEAETTVFNCVVAPLPATEQTSSTNGHPSCLEKVCASWQGSDPFCTKECTDNAGCPDGSTCQEHLEIRFCVPDEVVGVTSPGPVGGGGADAGGTDTGGSDAGGSDAGGSDTP